MFEFTVKFVEVPIERIVIDQCNTDSGIVGN